MIFRKLKLSFETIFVTILAFLIWYFIMSYLGHGYMFQWIFTAIKEGNFIQAVSEQYKGIF